MDRSSKAALSPQEIASLRRLRGDPQHSISNGHRHLLLSMQLIAVGADDLKLTAVGRNRLATEEADEGRREREPAGPPPAPH